MPVVHVVSALKRLVCVCEASFVAYPTCDEFAREVKTTALYCKHWSYLHAVGFVARLCNSVALCNLPTKSCRLKKLFAIIRFKIPRYEY